MILALPAPPGRIAPATSKQRGPIRLILRLAANAAGHPWSIESDPVDPNEGAWPMVAAIGARAPYQRSLPASWATFWTGKKEMFQDGPRGEVNLGVDLHAGNEPQRPTGVEGFDCAPLRSRPPRSASARARAVLRHPPPCRRVYLFRTSTLRGPQERVSRIDRANRFISVCSPERDIYDET